MNVLYQFNDKYAPYAGVSITSLFINNKEHDIDVWILGENISKKNINRFIDTAQKYKKRIHFIDKARIDLLIDKMKRINLPTYRGSYAANMRMFLSDILPDSVERVLYLDADTIVRKDISDMYNIELGDKAIAMVQDSLGEFHKEDIGFSANDYYYNSGVILFDMKRWNTLNLSKKIINHILNVRAQYPSPDQDLINVVCHKYIKCISPEFNFQPIHYVYTNNQYFRHYGTTAYYTADEIKQSRKDIKILHCYRFIGEFPWDKDNVHPYTKIFDKYLYISEWKNYEKKKADNGIIMKLEKIMYQVLSKDIFWDIFSLSHKLFYKKANKLSEKNQISSRM